MHEALGSPFSSDYSRPLRKKKKNKKNKIKGDGWPATSYPSFHATLVPPELLASTLTFSYWNYEGRLQQSRLPQSCGVRLSNFAMAVDLCLSWLSPQGTVALELPRCKSVMKLYGRK